MSLTFKNLKVQSQNLWFFPQRICVSLYIVSSLHLFLLFFFSDPIAYSSNAFHLLFPQPFNLINLFTFQNSLVYQG